MAAAKSRVNTTKQDIAECEALLANDTLKGSALKKAEKRANLKMMYNIATSLAMIADKLGDKN